MKTTTKHKLEERTIMKIESWKFDGRCPDCGSENLSESEDIEGNDITTCIDCGEQFMVVVNIKDALFY